MESAIVICRSAIELSRIGAHSLKSSSAKKAHALKEHIHCLLASSFQTTSFIHCMSVGIKPTSLFASSTLPSILSSTSPALLQSYFTCTCYSSTPSSSQRARTFDMLFLEPTPEPIPQEVQKPVPPEHCQLLDGRSWYSM